MLRQGGPVVCRGGALVALMGALSSSEFPQLQLCSSPTWPSQYRHCLLFIGKKHFASAAPLFPHGSSCLDNRLMDEAVMHWMFRKGPETKCPVHRCSRPLLAAFCCVVSWMTPHPQDYEFMCTGPRPPVTLRAASLVVLTMNRSTRATSASA